MSHKWLLFIYLLVVLGLCFCARAFSSCGEWGPLFIAVRGPLTIAASLVAEHRLQTRRLSSCGSRAYLLRSMWDRPRPGLEPVSPALAGRFSTTAPPGKPKGLFKKYIFLCLLSHNYLFLFIFLFLFWIYLAAPGLSCSTQDLRCMAGGIFLIAACRTFSCGMWDLVPWPGIEPGPPELATWSLSHWTTREVPTTTYFCFIKSHSFFMDAISSFENSEILRSLFLYYYFYFLICVFSYFLAFLRMSVDFPFGFPTPQTFHKRLK